MAEITGDADRVHPPSSQITKAPLLEHSRRQEYLTCGYVSGNLDDPLICAAGYHCSTRPHLAGTFWACCDAITCIGDYHTCFNYGAAVDTQIEVGLYTSLLSCGPNYPYCVTAERTTLNNANQYYPDTSYACGKVGGTLLVVAGTTANNQNTLTPANHGSPGPSPSPTNNVHSGPNTNGGFHTPVNTGPSPSTSTSSSQSSSLSTGAIVAVAVVLGLCVIGLALCVGCCVIWKGRRKKKKATVVVPVEQDTNQAFQMDQIQDTIPPSSARPEGSNQGEPGMYQYQAPPRQASNIDAWRNHVSPLSSSSRSGVGSPPASAAPTYTSRDPLRATNAR